MKVKLIDHTIDMERDIALSAKLCYMKGSLEDAIEKMSYEDIQKFVRKLMDMGHMSPLEHAKFTFYIEGISRACSHQLVRHRVASYSQQSQRYVSMDNFEYVIPPEIKNDPFLLDYYTSHMEEIEETYNELVKGLIKNGRDEKQAYEDARYILPNACCTRIIVTMNVRELLHFFEQRCCKRAQWEIREVANRMLSICKNIAPTLFTKAGAPCSTCKEGELKCK